MDIPVYIKIEPIVVPAVQPVNFSMMKGFLVS